MEAASQAGNISKQPFSLCTAVSGSSSGSEVLHGTLRNPNEAGLRTTKRTMRTMMTVPGRWKKRKKPASSPCRLNAHLQVFTVSGAAADRSLSQSTPLETPQQTQITSALAPEKGRKAPAAPLTGDVKSADSLFA